MNLSNLDELKKFLKSSNLRPKDYMGQNFLVDEFVLEKIVAAAELKKTDTVLEVGPGLGVLTSELIKNAGRVIAVEKDLGLLTLLRQNLSSPQGRRTNFAKDDSFALRPSDHEDEQREARGEVAIINQDILRFHLDEQIIGPYKVVANIPYYLTSKLFQYFLNQKNKPTLLVLMVQKEVGERVVAAPGKLSVLGISVQIFADAKIVHEVNRKSFWPIPEVDSVILKIEPNDRYRSRLRQGFGGQARITDHRLFFWIIKAAFAGKRKQVHNSLASGLNLPKEKIFELLNKAGIDPATRPQDISIEQWIALYDSFALRLSPF